MKIKFLLFFTAVLFFSLQLSSQNFYMDFNVGYNTGLSGFSRSSYERTTNQTTFNNQTTYNIINNFSYGKGLNVDIAFGRMYNENVGLELGVSYLFGSIGGITKINNISTEIIASDIVLTKKSESEYYANMLRLNPGIKFVAGKNKLKPYAKLGVVIGIGKSFNNNNSSEQYILSSELITQYTIEEYEYGGYFALGVNGSFGASYDFNDVVSLFCETNFISLSYSPTYRKLVKYTVDDVDQLEVMTTSYKEIEYVDTYTYNSNDYFDAEEPTKTLKTTLPFSSMGINLGIMITL